MMGSDEDIVSFLSVNDRVRDVHHLKWGIGVVLAVASEDGFQWARVRFPDGRDRDYIPHIGRLARITQDESDMTEERPTLEYATTKRRPRRAGLLDHFVWMIMGLLWSIAIALAVTLAGWILTHV